MTTENIITLAPTATLAASNTVEVILVDGADPAYVPLAERIAGILGDILTNNDRLNNGLGNCGVISAITHAVVTSAGYKSRLLGGNCLDAHGRAPFGKRGGHFWVELPDGTVIDGAGTNRVQIYRPEIVGYRMIPIIVNKRSGACMRKTKMWLELSASIQGAIAKGVDFRLSGQVAA